MIYSTYAAIWSLLHHAVGRLLCATKQPVLTFHIQYPYTKIYQDRYRSICWIFAHGLWPQVVVKLLRFVF